MIEGKELGKQKRMEWVCSWEDVVSACPPTPWIGLQGGRQVVCSGVEGFGSALASGWGAGWVGPGRGVGEWVQSRQAPSI